MEILDEALRLRLAKIQLLVLDVDGVLTDGTINISNDGELFKGFNVKDGLGIALALRHGVKVAIITGRKSEIVAKRLGELGVELILQGIADKAQALDGLRLQLGLEKENIAYMGDDLNDLPAMGMSEVRFAPHDAARDVLAYVDIIVEAAGGRGAVREAIEAILKAQDKWTAIVKNYCQAGQGDKQ